MAAIVDPIRVGTHFMLLARECEIAFVDGDYVRYANVAGGAQHTIKRDDLARLIKSGQAEVTFVSRSRHRSVPRELVQRTEKEIASGRRKHRYIKELVAELGWNWPVEAATTQIAKTAAAMGESVAPGYSTVCRWREDAQVSMKVTNLADDHYKRGCGSCWTNDQWDVIDDLLAKFYLVRPRRSIRDAWDLSLGELALDPRRMALFEKPGLPGIRTIERRIAGYDPIRVARARFGPAAARRLAKAAGKSVEVTSLLDLVYGDGHLLDVLIVPSVGGHPTAQTGFRASWTVLIEMATRAPISTLTTFAPFCSATVLAAFRKAVVADGANPRGKMHRLKVDNGGDYICAGLKRATFETGVVLEWAGPRDPDAKAVVERFIGSFTRYVHQMPGTVFCSPLQRGDYESERWACLTIEQFLEYEAAFLEIYCKRLHHGTGRAPIRLWNELAHIDPPVTYTFDEIDHITRVPHRRMVSNGRVKVDCLKWKSHALKTWEVSQRQKGAEPWVDVLVDEFNLETVQVETVDGKKTLFKADSTTPKYCAGLTLFEHEKIREHTKLKGLEDLESLDDHELEKLRYEMHENLAEAARVSRKSLKMLTRMNDRRRLADDAERARNASAEKKAASTPPPAVEGPSNTAESAVPPASLPPATQEVPTVPVPAAAAAPVGPPPRDIGGDFGDELRKLLGGVTRQLPVRVDRVERLHG